MPDGRKLSTTQLTEARAEAVALVGEGLPVAEVARRLGVSRPTIYNALKLAADGGAGLQAARRGRKKGTGSALSAQQQLELVTALSGWPIKAGINRRLWTRQLVSDLVQTRFQMALSDRVIADYCVRWGLDLDSKSSSPLERAAPAVREWLSENLDSLLDRVAGEQATLLWMNKHARLPDEPWTVNAGQAGRRYFVSVSNQQGRLQWMVTRGAFNAATQLALLKRLVADQPLRRKVILVRHSASVFGSGDVQAWLADHSRDVQVLPPEEALDVEEEKPVKALRETPGAPASPPSPACDQPLDDEGPGPLGWSDTALDP
jgi:transposase